jgi:hypothetical protein
MVVKNYITIKKRNEMKDIVINEINLLKDKEQNFLNPYWNDTYVSYNDKTVHISKADFDNMDDIDLVRLFKFIILRDNEITSIRCTDFISKNTNDDFNLSDDFLKENNIQYIKKVENHFRPNTPYMIKFSNSNERKWFDKESLIIFLNNLKHK